MSLPKYIFVLLYFHFCTAMMAQPQPHYNFESITINNGLPHSTVYRIVQDHDGFLWFGTQRGLIRYDGYTCRLFGQINTDSTGFLGKAVHALWEDKNGNLWVGTHSGDLCLRDGQTGHFRYLTNENAFKSLVERRIQTIFEDASGKIWIGTLDDGLLIYDAKTNTSQHFNSKNSHLSNNAVFAFVQDKSGRIWIATAGEGINYFDATTNSFKQIYADIPNLNGYQKTLLLDDKGNLWIGSDGTGLYVMGLMNNHFQHFDTQTNGGKDLNANAVMSLALTKDKQILIATDGGGLNVLNTETKVFRAYKNDNNINSSLNTNALYDVCIDSNDNIWLATFNGGVNVHKAHQIRFDYFSHTGTRANELSNRSVLGLCQSFDGNIWIGTDGGGLNLFDRKNNRFSTIPNSSNVPNKVVKTIFEDKRKRLWLGYFNGGLAMYDRANGSFRHFMNNPNDPLSISHNSVWSLAADSSGKLWVGTTGKGINLFDPETGHFQSFTHNDNDPLSISHDGIMIVYADKKENIWIGTEHSGLNLYNRNKNNFTHFQHRPNDPLSISSDYIRAIFEDSRGHLWIGTEGGGLNLWLDGKFKHYTTQNGLISNAIMGISEDRDGFLWLSSFEGISRFDTERDSFQNFKFNKTLDGMSNQFNQSAVLRTFDGEMMFGGINGLNIIRPESMASNDTKPPIILTDFKVFDISVANGKLPDGRLIFDGDISKVQQIELSYRDNAFSIEFAALDFTEPSRQQYAFKMDGFDKGWRYGNAEQRLVTYTNLDAGTYTFHVRGTNSSGGWSDNEATVKITIHPPFWKTIGFRLLLFLMVLGLGVLAFRIYLQRRESLLRQQVLESEQEILRLKNKQLESEQDILHLQNDKLETEIATKNNELMSTAVQMAHKTELLIGIKDNLEAIKTATETERQKSLRNLTRTLETEIENKETWDQFLLYFDQVNRNFITNLQAKHPNLTQNDLRMCALTRLNMSNREIATLLNISITGVEKSRYRLKKRLDLTVEEDLPKYLLSF